MAYLDMNNLHCYKWKTYVVAFESSAEVKTHFQGSYRLWNSGKTMEF